MMKAILISIKPKWVAKILNGEKTIEIRKSIPKCDFPIDVYIYVSKDRKDKLFRNNSNYHYFLLDAEVDGFNGQVVAKFTLKNVEAIKYHFGYYDMGEWTESYILENSSLSPKELDDYLQASKDYDEKKIAKVRGYAWHITNLKIFDKPKDLKDFIPLKWDKCGARDKNGLYQCHKCPHAIHYGHGFGDCGYAPLKRPPQSWCYVEV